MRFFILTLASLLAATPAFADDEKGLFAGYELFEMSMNNFRNFAGEVGYRFDGKHGLRLAIMNVKLAEKHLSNKYQAHATDNTGNVTGYFQRYELNYDRFLSPRWYVMARVS